MKIGRGKAMLLLWPEWDYIYTRTVQPYDILRAKNVLVNSAYYSYVREWTLCSLALPVDTTLPFDVHGSVHRNNIPLYKSQQDAQVTEFI